MSLLLRMRPATDCYTKWPRRWLLRRAFSGVETMAYVELDYSIDQERAICPQGLFFLKYGFSRFCLANHARAPPTRRDARRGRELLLLTSEEALQATLTEPSE